MFVVIITSEKKKLRNKNWTIKHNFMLHVVTLYHICFFFLFCLLISILLHCALCFFYSILIYLLQITQTINYTYHSLPTIKPIPKDITIILLTCSRLNRILDNFFLIFSTLYSYVRVLNCFFFCIFKLLLLNFFYISQTLTLIYLFCYIEFLFLFFFISKNIRNNNIIMSQNRFNFFSLDYYYF